MIEYLSGILSLIKIIFKDKNRWINCVSLFRRFDFVLRSLASKIKNPTFDVRRLENKLEYWRWYITHEREVIKEILIMN